MTNEFNNNVHLTENIAYVCTGKPCENGKSTKIAFRWIYPNLSSKDFTYHDVESSSNQIANVLKRLGIDAGDTVSIFLHRSPELIYSFFGILKNQAVSCILFSTFGENALYDRLDDSRTKIVITRKSLLKKILNIQTRLTNLQKILVVDIEEHSSEQVLSLPRLISQVSDEFAYPPKLPADTMAFLQYTSGSTGKPKAAVHIHGSLASMVQSFDQVLAVHENELFWCTADPAWITGLVYGIIAPLQASAQQIQFSGAYRAADWLSILQDQKVNVWYTSPTALRMLMQEEEQLFNAYDTSSLNRIYSVGEPLNAEIYRWGKQIFAREIFDTWFQSETGSIMIANRQGMTVKAGSMGKPIPGIEAYILDKQMHLAATGTQGKLCLKKGWPSMMTAYFRKEDLYREKFHGKYYITGDLAWQDEDGYFWYVSREDDVINSAGHLVGPFEVESALIEIEEVVDVAVIGAPDPIIHEKIVAFLCLRKGCEWSRALELKCRVNVSNRVSTTAIPQEFHIVDFIPKNQSGKILRRVLKAWYEGKDPGDLSTMEEK